MSRLQKNVDSFNDTVWYKSRLSPNYVNSNGFYLYFGVIGSTKLPLRLKLQYYDDDWLFIEGAKINIDGIIFDLPHREWERDNDSMIWEWSDEPLNDRQLIEAIIKSRNAVIRFEGTQYYGTRTLSSTQKKALQEVLLAWDRF